MINYKEIESIKELKKTSDADDKHCKIPLFHGTRRYAIQVSDADRERFSNACKQVLSFAHKFYYSGKLDIDKLETYWQKSGNRYFMDTTVAQYNSPLFQYETFYLASSYENAIGFAHNVGGEVGTWAHAQIQGFEDWGIELDKETRSAAETVRKEYKKYQNSEKVILIYYGVGFEDLYTEGGAPFIRKTVDKEHACKRINSLYKSTMNKSATRNFRLSNAHAYTAYLLPERMFRAGVVLFEDEPDVDEFIKRHNMQSPEQWSF